jgi:diaminohydroxyphosphoribosylaminopyrimidine deaminase/5-amino-6-(5-phosphoribosylamino)uracil reductase
VRKVVSSSIDPNPIVNGKGFARLKRSGIQCEIGLLEQETRELNKAYFKFFSQGLPYVVLKIAATLDGRIAAAGGHSQWITGEPSRKRDHQLRALSDAILVGRTTVELDNPQLTVRLVRGKSPVKVILDSSFALDHEYRVFGEGRTIWVGVRGRGESEAKDKARSRGIDILELPADGMGRVDLKQMLKALAERNIMSLLVEGGAGVASSFLKDRLADEFYLFLAPKVLGAQNTLGWAGDIGVTDLEEAVKLDSVRCSKVGDDVLWRGRFLDLGEN